MMREVFEAFLTDPIRINEDVYALWLEGHNAGDALAARLRMPWTAAADMPFLGGASADAAAKLRELLWRDTVDQYRLFDKLEHYLSQPSLFRSQLLFQIPPIQQHYMIERYYSLDAEVGRWLLGKKLSSRLEKDLDEVAERSGCTIKSCRRQLENLRRVYSAVEDRNFHGIPCKAVSELFLVSEQLASKYACLLFILHARFQVHPQHPSTGFLTWHDLRFFAALLMVHWLPQRKTQPQLMHSKRPHEEAGEAVVEHGAEIALRSPATGEWPAIGFLQEKLQPMSVRATVGLDLSHPFTNCLRDLKAHLVNDNDVLKVYREEVMTRLRSSVAAGGAVSDSSQSLNQLESKLYLVVHGFLTIGAGLSQPKEIQHLLEHLLSRVVRVLHDCEMRKPQLNALFSALVDALAELDVWYLNGQETRGLLLASWDRFISVCRVVILSVYDRCHPMAVSAHERDALGIQPEATQSASSSAQAASLTSYESQPY